MLGLGLTTTGGMSRGRAPAWTPARLFSSGEQGVWYEPKPEYLYQDAAGTTPVTADGDPVGLMLDRSRGLLKGPERVTNGTFDTDVSGWATGSGSSITWDSGAAVIERNSSGVSHFPKQAEVLEVGKFYLITIDVLSLTNSVSVYFGYPDLDNEVSFFATGAKKTGLIKATGADLYVGATGAYPASCTVDNITVRELPGNHAMQSTSASRPIYRTAGELHWLEFDGVDDYLDMTGVTTGVDHTVYTAENTSNTTGAYTFDSELGRFVIMNNGDRGLSYYDGAFKQAAARQTGDVVLVYQTEDGVGGTIRSNQVEYPGLTYTASSIGGNCALGAFHSSGGNYIVGRLYGFILTESLGGIEATEKYFTELAGVTL